MPRIAIPKEKNMYYRGEWARHTIPGVPPITPHDTHLMKRWSMPRRTSVTFRDFHALDEVIPKLFIIDFYICQHLDCNLWMSPDDLNPEEIMTIEGYSSYPTFKH